MKKKVLTRDRFLVHGGFIAKRYKQENGQWKKIKEEKREGYLNTSYWGYGFGSKEVLKTSYDFESGEKLMTSKTSISPDGKEKFIFTRDYKKPVRIVANYKR